MTARRQILVTNALPYANGPIHLGHLLGYIQADIWVRAMRMLGHDVIYVCADDAHGTAIMLKADENGISPQEQIAQVNAEHQRDFAGFFVAFDHYDSTDSPTNKQLAEDIYLKNDARGNITIRPVTQLFDPQKQLFLSDRFIKGSCPSCGAGDQYGDNCDACGETYNATDLINPHSTLSGAVPISKESEHYFFQLPNYSDFLQCWTRQNGRLPQAVANKLDEWFAAGLKDWDISRDAPYFGFQIPNAPGKFFYVWVDAPIGYIASFKNYIDSARPDVHFEDFWAKDSESKSEIYHFIGKDIVYFHALFWPAMLTGADYRTPTGLFVNGFLTVNGTKMSKSRGTFIKAATYLEHLDPEYLRYYFAAKLNNSVEDSDLNLEDFVAKINADLIGKVINIASRCAKFIGSHFAGMLLVQNRTLIDHFIQQGDAIFALYEAREYSAAVREIMALTAIANQFIDDKKPWAMIKDANNQAQVQDVCSIGINLFFQLSILLAPILPNLAQKVQHWLGLEHFDFVARKQILSNYTIKPFAPLMQRLDPKNVQAMIDDSKENLTQSKPPHTAAKATTDSATIGIDDFSKVQIKVAHVLSCSTVAGSDKLLQFSLDIGEQAPRNVFSGIAKFYQPADLQGKKVLCVSNLAPRKMTFGLSEGMILSAEKDGKISVVLVEDTLPAGAQLS